MLPLVRGCPLAIPDSQTIFTNDGIAFGHPVHRHWTTCPLAIPLGWKLCLPIKNKETWKAAWRYAGLSAVWSLWLLRTNLKFCIQTACVFYTSRWWLSSLSKFWASVWILGETRLNMQSGQKVLEMDTFPVEKMAKWMKWTKSPSSGRVRDTVSNGNDLDPNPDPPTTRQCHHQEQYHWHTRMSTGNNLAIPLDTLTGTQVHCEELGHRQDISIQFLP